MFPSGSMQCRLSCEGRQQGKQSIKSSDQSRQQAGHKAVLMIFIHMDSSTSRWHFVTPLLSCDFRGDKEVIVGESSGGSAGYPYWQDCCLRFLIFLLLSIGPTYMSHISSIKNYDLKAKSFHR